MAFWLEEGAILGYEFSEDMPIVFEEFEVLEVLNRQPAERFKYQINLHEKNV